MINRKKLRSLISSIILCAIVFENCAAIRVPVDWSEIQQPYKPYRVSNPTQHQPYVRPFNQWSPTQQYVQPAPYPPKRIKPKKYIPQAYESVKHEQMSFKEMEPHLEIPKFAQKIYENDPFVAQSRMDEEVEHEIPQDPTPISEHEFPLEIPTKPIYPGPGQWAKPGIKHKPFIRPESSHKSEDVEDETTTPDGYEAYQHGVEQFQNAQKEFNSKLRDFPEEHNLAIGSDNVEDHENLYREPKIGFVPQKTYAQIRRSENVRHLPQSEALKEASTDEEIINAPRLKEVIKNTRAHTYYTEEGYEDEAYDHAGKEKKAENNENSRYLEHDLEKLKERVKSMKSSEENDEGGSIRGDDNEERLINEEVIEEDDEDEDKYVKLEGDGTSSGSDFKYTKKPKSWGKDTIKETRKKEVNSDTVEIATNVEKVHHPKGLQMKKTQKVKKVLAKDEPHHRIKRYDRERLSKIYIRRYPDYYWKKSKNRGNMKIENRENQPVQRSSTQRASNATLPKTFHNFLSRNRTRRSPNEFTDFNVDDLKHDIVDVTKLKLPEPKPDLTHIKYPYYLMSESKVFNKHSPLKYAEDLRNIPVKTEGGMEFYESTAHIQCPEVDDDINPDRNEGDPNPPKKVRRLKGLGDKIDCMKIKYFGENPLDSPFFKEELIEPPSVDYVFPNAPKFSETKQVSHIQQISKGTTPVPPEALKKIAKYLGTKKIKREIERIVVLNEEPDLKRNDTKTNESVEIRKHSEIADKRSNETKHQESNRRNSDDFVIIIDTNGENISDVPLHLPLVDDKNFADTFDINKFFPKYNLETPTEFYDSKTKTFGTKTPNKDQMAVFADILQHLTTESSRTSTHPTTTSTTTTKSNQKSRRIKIPHKKIKMSVTNSTLPLPGTETIFDFPKSYDFDHKVSESQIEEVGAEALEVEDLNLENPRLKYPGTFNSLYVQDNDIINRDVYMPKDHYKQVAEYSGDPNHAPATFNHAPIVNDHFRNIGNSPNPVQHDSLTLHNQMNYDLVYNRQQNSYVLRPGQIRYETGFQPIPKYSPLIKEEVVIRGIKPIPHPNGIKFIIPKSKLPIRKPPMRIIRLRLKPKKVIRLPPPPQALLVPLPQYYRRRTQTTHHQADYYNIDGMVPPIHSEHIISYSDYNPVQFAPDRDFAGSDITPSYLADSVADEDQNQLDEKSFKDMQMEASNPLETVVDLSGKPVRKYMLELDRTNRQANHFTTAITPMEGEVLMEPITDSYGENVSDSKSYASLLAEMRRTPKNTPNESIVSDVVSDQRRGEPKYEKPHRGFRTALDTIPHRSRFRNSRMDHSELSIFKVMQSPEIFDVNKFIPDSKLGKEIKKKSNENESFKSVKYSSRYNSDKSALPLPTEKTLQKPVNLVTEEPTTQRVIKLRRKRPTTEAPIRRVTTPVRSRQLPLRSREETRVRKQPVKLVVDPIALRQKARLEEAKTAHSATESTPIESSSTTEIPKEEDETLTKEYSEQVEIIGNLEQIRNGPKHGGNYRHYTDQKYDDTNHDDKTTEEDVPKKSKYSTYKFDFPESKSSRSSSDREKLDTKEKEEFDEDYDKTSSFYSDQTLPKRINNLKHKTADELDDFLDGLESSRKVVKVKPEVKEGPRATWSKIIKDPSMRQYFYVRE